MYLHAVSFACAQISRAATTATRDDAIASGRIASYPVRGPGGGGVAGRDKINR